MPDFDKNQLAWLAAPEIFGSLLHQMLAKTPLNIGTDTGI
ncbi:hypothetical protein EDE11_11092 [Methylomonas methanica]|uniref:Uncharacterized protein n=1 Tax=Methylomonas methanica TaxID=421 RepID=A0ABY2CLC1_METMH|nr:hypothetical protein EDE11_11092 [Methylomonas methanica]